MTATLEDIFQDKSIKAKARVKEICKWLGNGELLLEELLIFTNDQSPVIKATCIEAIECLTRTKPDLADENLINYVTDAMTNEEPRVKWESARVVGNIAKHFPNKLDMATDHLLKNSNNKGTVVRWATAYALGEILKSKEDTNGMLQQKIESLSDSETDNGVKKKYLDALKQVKKL